MIPANIDSAVKSKVFGFVSSQRLLLFLKITCKFLELRQLYPEA